MVRTLVAIRELHGLDATSPASIRMCARMARRLTLDELLEMVDVGVDGPDRVLLCDAAIWLDALVSAPHAWVPAV
jgi:hypothetical protein